MSIRTYWQNEYPRFVTFLSLSLVFVIASWLFNWYGDFREVFLFIVPPFLFYVYLTWYLKGRAYSVADHYKLIDVWRRKEEQRKLGVGSAVSLLVLMEYPIFYLAYLILLLIAVTLFLVELPEDASNVKSFYDAVYLTLISATPIGFGDVTPKTGIGKALTVASSLVGMTVFGVFVGSCMLAIQKTYIVFLGSDDDRGIPVN